MKAIASRERKGKNEALVAIESLRATISTMQNQFQSMNMNMLGQPMNRFVPMMMPGAVNVQPMIGAPGRRIVEADSIESVEVPAYLK